jgi:hypothetical protein
MRNHNSLMAKGDELQCKTFCSRLANISMSSTYFFQSSSTLSLKKYSQLGGDLDMILFDPCIELGTKVCKTWHRGVEVNDCFPCSLTGMYEIKYHRFGGILAHMIHGLSIIIHNSTVPNSVLGISSSATGREWVHKTCIGKLKKFVTMHEINHCKCFVKKLCHGMIYLQMEQRFMAISQFSLWLQIDEKLDYFE